MLQTAVGYLLVKGIGIWGITIPIGWGFAIVNFVWWIGIGHAGTLISAILLLFKQTWRTSINRFAEAMTIFAVMQAGLFPLIHTGRPWLAAYWLFPIPTHHGRLAAVSQPADLGRVCCLNLFHGIVPVLGHRTYPRLRHTARLSQDPGRPAHLWHVGDGLAWIGQALEPV